MEKITVTRDEAAALLRTPRRIPGGQVTINWGPACVLIDPKTQDGKWVKKQIEIIRGERWPDYWPD